MRLFTVNSNVYLKRLIAIKVLLQCWLASCNCSVKLSKRHMTNLHTKNGVRSTAQISGLFGQQKHSELVGRIWLHVIRNVTKVLVTRAVLLSYWARQKQKNNFLCYDCSRLQSRRMSVPTSGSQTQNGDMWEINRYSTCPLTTHARELQKVAIAEVSVQSIKAVH